MSDKAVSEQNYTNLRWASNARGDVIDISGAVVCIATGSCYAEKRRLGKFIATAANNHYKLVEALEACMEIAEGELIKYDSFPPENEIAGWHRDACREALGKARQALAEVKS